MDIENLIEKQRNFFSTNKTLNIDFRLEKLKLLKQNILSMQEEIYESLYKDLNKSKIESYMCEVHLCIEEIDYFLKNLKKLSKPKKIRGTLLNFPSKSLSFRSPYGVTLIMSPWNYPFLLTIQPLIESIASGNTAILKVGSYSINTSNTLSKLIKNTFDEEYVALLTGDRTVNQNLLKQKFDYVFFTGSKEVGKVVLQSQSEFLTPVTLELGGKSPTIIEKTADLKLSAKRVIFGKLINAGQTCIAPDYIIIDQSIKEKFIENLKQELVNQVGNNPLIDSEYGKIINKKHFDRLSNLLANQKVIYGGKVDAEKLKIEPTIIDIDSLNNPLMQEEIFGPILPIVTYQKEEEIFSIIDKNPSPLSLYYFGYNKTIQNKILSQVKFGGGAINDTIMQLISNMSFGGVGNSGMGRYHKKVGFETFTYAKNVLIKDSKIDFSLRYRPYTTKKQNLIKKILK